MLAFQSTLPCGSDLRRNVALEVIPISIHAPLRERRAATGQKDKTSKQFQSTLPCGSDAAASRLIYTWIDFNPRSLAGATKNMMPLTPIVGISIHAPLRERHTQHPQHSSLNLFQSTLPCGSDFNKNKSAAGHKHFNPRSLAGATNILFSICRLFLHFNPRSLAGATAIWSRVILPLAFQSTLPCGSDATITHGLPGWNDFNPRSLAGATSSSFLFLIKS